MDVLQNVTNETEAYDFSEVPTGAKIPFALILLIIIAIGCGGNMIAFLLVYKKTSMRSAINLLLANMALADIFLGIVSMPFVFSTIVSKIHIHSIVTCLCFSTLQNIFVSVSIYTLLTISVDRYLIIVHRRDKLTPKSAKVLIGMSWTLSSILFIFPMIFILITSKLDDMICVIISRTTIVYSTYHIIIATVVFFVPFLVMTYTYSRIQITVRKNSRKIHVSPGSCISVSVTQYSCKLGLPAIVKPYKAAVDLNFKRRAFKTIFILFFTCVLFWLPYAIYLTLVGSASIRQREIAIIALICVGFTKSASNPIIYAVRIKKYREACFKILPLPPKIPISLRVITKKRVNPGSLYECSDAT
ncbi:hypothetical protein CHS0354_011435 [Potamilus streckersoni]|uniref:G-protein coupled receptors family 1 profile domain-containing protein n=1 Tax=Potamilus streckersoni TaxID=2493646 RepID=A0AAE0VXP7_9BIVA|nr:hypothetical protein CHS0354_011435 [Potamilus streckersoni]